VGILDSEGVLEGVSLGLILGIKEAEGNVLGDSDGGYKNLSFQSGSYGNLSESVEPRGWSFLVRSWSSGGSF